jgi:hypothetical protein
MTLDKSAKDFNRRDRGEPAEVAENTVRNLVDLCCSTQQKIDILR